MPPKDQEQFPEGFFDEITERGGVVSIDSTRMIEGFDPFQQGDYVPVHAQSIYIQVEPGGTPTAIRVVTRFSIRGILSSIVTVYSYHTDQLPLGTLTQHLPFSENPFGTSLQEIVAGSCTQLEVGSDSVHVRCNEEAKPM